MKVIDNSAVLKTRIDIVDRTKKHKGTSLYLRDTERDEVLELAKKALRRLRVKEEKGPRSLLIIYDVMGSSRKSSKSFSVYGATPTQVKEIIEAAIETHGDENLDKLPL